MHSAWTDFQDSGRDRTLLYLFMLVAIGLVIPLNTACVARLHCNIRNKRRNRLKIPQIVAILRIKLLCVSCQDFDYQAAIDLFEDGTGAGRGLQAQLAKEVNDVHVPFIADNEEEDVQDFADVDSDATVSECVFSDDEIVEQSAVQPEPLYAYIADANGYETLGHWTLCKKPRWLNMQM